MIKKDISKVLTEGTPKQKLLIIAEDEARKMFIFYWKNSLELLIAGNVIQIFMSYNA